MTFDVVVLPGDGIGPEVVAEAVRVLRHVEELSGGDVAFRLETFAAGADAWRRSGTALADDVYAACTAADAILLGAAGLPDARHADGREAGSDAIFRLRFGLDLYAGIRPVRLFAGVPSPLRWWTVPAGDGEFVVALGSSTVLLDQQYALQVAQGLRAGG